MAEAAPPAAAEGQGPSEGEGQEPAGEAASEGQEPGGKSYSETYVRQLRREAAGLRGKLSEAEDKLTEREEADKTEAERLSGRASTAEARATDAEMKLLRFEVAAESGLDAAAVKFLVGSTREELEHRAVELKQLLEDKGRPAAVGYDGGARQPAPAPKGKPEVEHNQFLLDAMGRGQRTR